MNNSALIKLKDKYVSWKYSKLDTEHFIPYDF